MVDFGKIDREKLQLLVEYIQDGIKFKLKDDVPLARWCTMFGEASILYPFFDSHGLFVQILWEHLPINSHFKARIGVLPEGKHTLLPKWFSTRSEAETEAFTKCFELLNVPPKS